jgi:hypothetical protein
VIGNLLDKIVTVLFIAGLVIVLLAILIAIGDVINV